MELLMPARIASQDTSFDDPEDAVRAFGSQMYALAVAITGNIPDAEDAYQIAWLDALGHWNQLREKSKRRQWLASIVARSAKRTRQHRGLWFRRHTLLDDAPALSLAIHWDPTLGAALSRLSERQRTVIVLHYGHGYTLDEIAAILECRGGSVRGHLSRELANLRRSLHDDDA
jgi:RNA polymerase sigma-70 factor (ECF subfamily)